MVQVYPRLRSDIVFTEQESPGASAMVLKDPISERFFRFDDLEGYIIRQLDGTSTLETIGLKVRKQFNASVSPDALSTFVGRLANLGLLESPEQMPLARQRWRRIKGNLFYLRIRLLNPDSLLNRLVEPLGFFFTRRFAVLSAICIIVSAILTIIHWGEIQRDILNLLSYYSLITVWLVIIAMIAAHEFAHGLACKRFGGHVRNMGFLLLYFMPGFYCDVSDAWLFQEKSKRLLVTLAGGYFELFLWSLSAFLWYLTESPSAIHDTALIVMATSGIKALFNFNPLIKLDGYYLLSDYLEIPNLRQKAFGYIKSLLFGKSATVTQEEENVSSRRRKVYLIYGFLSMVFTTWLMTSLLYHLGGYLMTEYKGWGFAAFGVFISGLSRNRILKTLGALKAKLGLARMQGSRIPKRLFLFGILVTGLIASYLIKMPLTVTGDFNISPVENTNVRSEVSEIISEIHVDEGDTVHPGDLIVSLSDRTIRSELKKTVAMISETSAKLKLARAGPRSEEISLAETRVTKAQERLEFALKDLSRNEALMAREVISGRELDASKELAALRKKELEEAISALEILRLGSRPEEIESLEAELQAMIVQKQYYESQLNLLHIYSTTSGVVVTPKLKEMVGKHVEKGELIAKVFDLRNVMAEIVVSEKDIGEVMVGQPIEIKARAYPARTFHSTVTTIAPVLIEGDEFRDDKTVLVRSDLDNSESLLKIGMSGNAKIICEKRRIIDLLVRKIYNFFRIEFWSWW